MMCDELKSYGMDDPAIGEEYEMYKVAEVDEAIAELKKKLAEKESWVKMLGEGEATLSLELEKTKQKLEDVQASMYCDVVDANMENRRLRRALYKACANWADVEVFERTIGIDDPNVEASRWALMRNKCLKKAEEYK